MSVRRKIRGIVALAAAYALALQAIFVVIDGTLAGATDLDVRLGPSFAASSLCRSLRLGVDHPAPGGHQHDCLATCIGCCCGAQVAPAGRYEAAYEVVPAGLIAATVPIVPTWRVNVERAHRSRAPPLG